MIRVRVGSFHPYCVIRDRGISGTTLLQLYFAHAGRRRLGLGLVWLGRVWLVVGHFHNGSGPRVMSRGILKQ